MPLIGRPSPKASFDSVAARQIEQCQQIEGSIASAACARAKDRRAISADCKLSTARAEEPRDGSDYDAICTTAHERNFARKDAHVAARPSNIGMLFGLSVVSLMMFVHAVFCG